MAFAEVWDGWRFPDGETVRTFIVVKTDPNAIMATVHIP
jgi:putative SOS response-associated peptidase YedK